MSGSYYDVLALESRAYDIAHWIATEARVAESLDRSVAPIESEGARRIVALASARPTPAASEDVREPDASRIGLVGWQARLEVYGQDGDGIALTEVEVADLLAAIRSALRTPRGEGEGDALGMLQASVDEYLWEAQNNPQFDAEAAFAALSREIRAALRSEAQGDAEALAAADMERVPTTKGER